MCKYFHAMTMISGIFLSWPYSFFFFLYENKTMKNWCQCIVNFILGVSDVKSIMSVQTVTALMIYQAKPDENI